MERNLRLLIVEDNEDDMTLLLRALKQQGFAVMYDRVETPSAMQASLTNREWDAVISDYNMPKFNALDALKILDSSGIDLPFLLVSGTITEEMAVAGMKAGAHDYLMKGNLARLGPALERELEEAANRRERKKAEEDRDKSDEKFRATFRQAAVGMAHLDFDGRWLLVNPKLCETLGYSEEELRGFRFHDITFAGDLPGFLALFEPVTRGESNAFTVESRYLRRDGSQIWLSVNVSLIRDEGKPAYCLCVVEDINDRKRDELEIQQLYARLSRAMTETHHRVRNNLQEIIAMIEMRDNGEKPIASHELKGLRRAVTTMALVHDLLTQRAKQDASANWLYIHDMLDQLLNLLRETTPDRSIEAQLDEAQMSADKATALALIVTEMINNALKHSAGKIEVAFQVTGSRAKLTVMDTGAGFAADFSPYRADSIGLELLDSLTRHDLGGTIRFGNRPEGGGCVTAEFPLPPV